MNRHSHPTSDTAPGCYGHDSFSRYSYAAIGSAVQDYRAGRDRSLCFVPFNSAKKFGKVVGSIRFRRVDL